MAASEPPVPDDAAATVALLLSVVGLLGCLPVGVVGLVMGYAARDRIRQADGALGGERTAHWSIVVGWVAVAVSVLALVAFAIASAVRRGA